MAVTLSKLVSGSKSFGLDLYSIPPLSTQEYRCIPVNCKENPIVWLGREGEVIHDGIVFHPPYILSFFHAMKTL